jgi:Ca2+/H+ antiporter, TMEM165/GDT1 family
MEALLTSLGVVAIAEIGDKTQLLSLCLASRFRKPVPILAGILLATLANHAVAAGAGEWVGALLTPVLLRWVLGLSFIAMALWALVPDHFDEDSETSLLRRGAFFATLVSFFIAEIGDKTQLATVALAARFESFPAVVAGTTAGMMLANLPAVLGGHWLGRRFDPRWMRYAASLLFAAQGELVFAGYTFV